MSLENACADISSIRNFTLVTHIDDALAFRSPSFEHLLTRTEEPSKRDLT